MEKKLHPLFRAQSAQDGRISNIQTHFDPTPSSMTQNFIENKPAPATAPEFAQEIQHRLNRLTQKVANLEDRIDNITAEVRSAYTRVAGKISERALNDGKIESLMERHNQTINAFEKRLAQMVKIIDDSQSQLISTQGSLEEARREIARLKKI